MRFRFLVLATILLSIPAAARAEGPGFSCTPPDFSISKADKGYRLTGIMRTPTPGYSYAVKDVEETADGVINAHLEMTPPAGNALMVLSHVTVDYVFETKNPIGTINVTVDKLYGWGDSAIRCADAATPTPQEPALSPVPAPKKEPPQRQPLPPIREKGTP
jgi:hypothetical protein